MTFDSGRYAEQIRKLVRESLQRPPTEDQVALAMAAVVARAETDLAEKLGAEAGHIACRAGCGACCVVHVGVLFPEVITIGRYLHQHLEGGQRRRLADKLEELDRDTRWLDEEERILVRRPCVFLDEQGCCGIYPVRPLLCRSVTSTDPEDCREALTAPVFGAEAPVLMNLLQKSLMEAAFSGVGKALADLGLDARGMRLSTSLRLLWRVPATAASFLAGDQLVLY